MLKIAFTTSVQNFNTYDRETNKMPNLEVKLYLYIEDGDYLTQAVAESFGFTYKKN